MVQPVKPSTQSRGWLILLLSVLSGSLTAMIPVALIAAPALWAYAGVRNKPVWIAAPAIGYAVCAYFLYPGSAVVSLTLMTSAAAAASYVMHRRKESNTNAVLLLSAVFLAGLYGVFCLPGVLSGEGAFAAIQAEANALIPQYREQIALATYLSADAKELTDEFLTFLSTEISTYVVAVLSAGAALLGLSNHLFFRLFCKKREDTAPVPMRPFRLWSLPRSMVLGLFSLMAIAFLLSLSGWTYSDGLTRTANVLVGLPMMVQGLSVTDFFIERSKRRRKKLARVLIYTAIGMLSNLFMTPLMVVGMFDQIFRFRKRLEDISAV